MFWSFVAEGAQRGVRVFFFFFFKRSLYDLYIHILFVLFYVCLFSVFFCCFRFWQLFELPFFFFLKYFF